MLKHLSNSSVEWWLFRCSECKSEIWRKVKITPRGEGGINVRFHAGRHRRECPFCGNTDLKVIGTQEIYRA